MFNFDEQILINAMQVSPVVKSDSRFTLILIQNCTVAILDWEVKHLLLIYASFGDILVNLKPTFFKKFTKIKK